MKLGTIEKKVLELLEKLEPGQSKIEVGRLLVTARREHFTTPAGDIDWQGRSMAYRRWWGSILNDLGLEGKERNKLSASVRYATGNALREMLTDSELEEAGLLPTSPRERGKASYDNVARFYNRFLRASQLTTDDEDEIVHLIGFLLAKFPKEQRDSLLDNKLTPELKLLRTRES